MKYKAHKEQGHDAIGSIINTYTQKISADALFINAYFDINKFGNIKPYVTAGVGVAKVKTGDIITTSNRSNDSVNYEDGKNNNQFAWNLGTGVNYALNDRVELNLIGYKYNNLGKVKTKESSNDPALTTKLAVHSINTGIIFKF